MSNWWKRFFGFGEDDEFEENEPFYGQSHSKDSLSTTKGRFEDPGRRIEVRMVNQYPSARKTSESRKPVPQMYRGNSAAESHKKEVWDEPAYTRLSRKRPSESRTDHVHSPYKEFHDNDYYKEQWDQQVNERSIKKKKVPFRPTTVASPIFGYRERKVVRSPLPETQEQNLQQDNGVIDENPLVVSTETEAVISQVFHNQNQPGNFEDNLQGDSQPLSEHDVYEEDFIEDLTDQDSEPFLSSKEEPMYHSGAHALITESKAPQEETAYPAQVDEWDEEKSDPYWNEDAGEVIYNESMTLSQENPDWDEDEQEEIHQTDIKSEDEPDSASTAVPPRSSAIPYNVLMYGADKQALRRKQQNQVTGVQSVNTLSREETAVAAEIQSFSLENEAVEPDIQQPKALTERRELTLDLLQDPPGNLNSDGDWIAEKQDILQQVLKNFHVRADIVSYVQGPTVTRFEIRLHPGVKVSKVVSLTEDIKLSMAAEQIRIAPVAGKSTVGIEIPNEKRKPVYLKSLLQSEAFQESASPLTAALGLDISGREVVTDLAKMPHGLIAGATGSGKSVCIHSLILSLIYKSDPESLRLVLIDPKVVELSMYQRLPHLAAPVINQPKDAALALRWAVEEMERRYQAFANIGVRDIKKYNQTVGPDERWPYIVIIIDELADLMMVSPQDVEEAICRIAQKARAAGIHMILATQRPSVDVITGLIKANIPTRIAFGVSSQADSRTILDSGGAERLLGQGDMLFAENGSRDVQRLQGAFVSDDEIDRVTDFFMSWPAPPHLFDPVELREQRQLADDEEDELYMEAANFVISQGQASVSSLQRHFRIGYNRAARLIDCLEANDIISEANGSKPRQVLVTKEMFMAEHE